MAITPTGTEHLNNDQFSAHLSAYRKNIINAGYGVTPKNARPGHKPGDDTQTALRKTMRAGVRQASYNTKSAAMNSSLSSSGGSMYTAGSSNTSTAPNTKTERTVSKTRKTTKNFRALASKHAGRLAQHLKAATRAA